jgi:hypothetical protein
LRGEAAVALVDIGRSEDVDQAFGAMSADERAEISKTVVPAYEVAMKDPAPEKALAYRDALFSLRQYGNPDEQKRIDDALMPAVENALKTGKVRQGRHSVEKMLTAMGRDASSMLARVLSEPDAPYTQAAELLAKVGDDSARDAGAAALIARAPQIKVKDKQHPELLFKALGALGGPTAIKFLEDKVSGKDKDEAQMATRAWASAGIPRCSPSRSRSRPTAAPTRGSATRCSG